MQRSAKRPSGRELLPFLLLLAAAAACAGAAPEPRTPPPSAAAPRLPPIFEFHQPIGLNLHHFLYWTALPHRRDTGDPALLHWPEGLDEAERAAVDEAAEYYRTSFEGQDLLFGDDLYRIKRALIEHDGGDSFAGLGLDPEHAAVLARTLPIYREHLWPAHQASHQAWIEEVSAAVDRHGEAMVELLVGVIADDFPPRPVRVDVVGEGHWAEAYTSTGPVHIVANSTRPRLHGLLALELIFHEATHGILGPGRGTPVEELDAAFAARGAESPDGLWHALLFYTTAWTAEQVLHQAGFTDYRPIPEILGIYQGRWKAYVPALEGPWQRYLDGELDRQQAVDAMTDLLLAGAEG